jgi:capsular polysaccharide biosynthesis protein
VAPPPTPTAPKNYTVVASVVIAGSGFSLIAASPAAWTALQQAVVTDLATYLGVNASQVSVTNMQVATNDTGLIVNFTVTTTDPVQAATIATQVSKLTSATNAFPLTSAQYKNAVPNGQNLTVTQATGTDSGSSGPSISGAFSTGVRTLVMAALGLVALTSFVL